ncbi:MAG TPA: tryptophan--tRNA ligase [Candidatus Binatia bacterium]|jgi:tryptophanyl-tRNA synthetase|nr:tryptophan--tRNA ligase [Candidatus Binatia bacterium]
MSKPVILTGLRANNDLHIGNYFGALLPLIDIAKQHSSEYDINLFVPDLHSFTTPIDHKLLQAQILHNLKLYMAAGLPLDNESVHIYRQSCVPAHSELTWILSCFTGYGEMSRMVEFKDKAAKLGDDRVTIGLFSYPILMAADILLYSASYVPVGDDQRQHLEFARDISERINKRFGDLFVIPEPVVKQHEFFGKDQALRIKDLVDPQKKMSKSDESVKGIVFLGDKPETAAAKIMGAATDSLASIHYDLENQPGISNLLQILSLLESKPLEIVAAQWEGKSSYGELKSAVAEAMKHFLANFQTNLSQVDEDKLLSKLEADEAKMNLIANATLLKVQTAVGLRP